MIANPWDATNTAKKKTTLKILCVCEHGNVRSVALAYLIKLIYKHEAIAIGVADTSEDTRDLFYRWADRIIFLDKNIPEYTRLKNMTPHQTINVEELRGKVDLLDVGKDIWFDPFHHSLQHKLLKQIQGLYI